jgi:calcineurin-like phosphoesterase family protein
MYRVQKVGRNHGDKEMNWYTADQHFHHDAIITHCRRPFKHTREMDNAMVDRYNSVVHNTDTVYFLGDLFDLKLGRSPYIVDQMIRRLKGRKILILGSHDYLTPFEYVELGFESVHTSLVVGEFICVHDVAPSCIDRSKVFLCGHVHDLFDVQLNVINVGVDVRNFYPVNEDQIMELKKKCTLLPSNLIAGG